MATMLRASLAGVAAAFAARAAAQTAPPQRFQEIWSIDADSTSLVAPRALAVTASCAVFVADAVSGLWRVPCSGGTPAKLGRADTASADSAFAWNTAIVGRDTIAVWNRSATRMDLYSSAGTFIGSHSLAASGTRFGRVVAISMPKDTTFLAWSVLDADTSDSRGSRSYVLALGHDGSVRDSLAVLPGVSFTAPDTGSIARRAETFLRRGAFVSFLRDGGFVVGNSSHSRVDVHDVTGRLLRVVQLPLPPRGGGAGAARRDFYDQLIVDERQDVAWVLLSGSALQSSRTWLVCTLNDPGVCRSLTVPHRGAVLSVAISGGAIYAIEQGADRVPRLTKYAER